jgi:YbbR domain-containing protein
MILLSKKNKNSMNDSTTDFFLKMMKKEQDDSKKMSSSRESFESKTTKTIDKASKIYNYFNKALDKLLSNNRNIFVISVLLTLVLFFTISGGDILSSPTSGSTLENVPISIVGLDENYEISGVPDDITVGLIGPSLNIYSTRIADDYEVYLDVTGYTAGDYTVNLKYRNFPDSLDVMLVPNSLKVTISKKVESTFELGYHFINEDELDDQYSVTVNKMSANEVVVYASKDTLSEISKVEACIDVADRTKDFEDDANIKVYDRDGNEMDVDINVKKVHVNCSVSSYSKNVPIKVNLIGNVADGYTLTNYSITDETVTIYGTEENLKNINEVTCDVSIEDLMSTITMTNVELNKNEKISKFSDSNVDITLQIEKLITKRFDNITIKVLNKASDKKVSFIGDNKYASVQVEGPESIMNDLTEENIQASIDVNDLDVGTKKVKVSVTTSDDLDIQLISSKEISINIERN